MPERRRSLLVFLSGAGLLLLQFSAARSLSSLLLGTELILFLVVFSYFAGLSTGFALSGFLDERRLRLFLWAQWLTQLTLPFSLRWLTGLLAEDSGNAFLLVLILFLGAFWASSLYSIILPRLLASRGDEDASGFARRYGLEALGGACGLAAAFFAARLHPALPMILQQAVLALIFALLLGGRGPALLFAAGAAAYAAAFAPLERASAALANADAARERYGPDAIADLRRDAWGHGFGTVARALVAMMAASDNAAASFARRSERHPGIRSSNGVFVCFTKAPRLRATPIPPGKR